MEYRNSNMEYSHMEYRNIPYNNMEYRNMEYRNMEYRNMEYRNSNIECRNNMLSYIRKNKHLVNYLINFKENKSFMYNNDTEINEIHTSIIEDGIALLTFSTCLRNCQNILKKEIKYDIFSTFSNIIFYSKK